MFAPKWAIKYSCRKRLTGEMAGGRGEKKEMNQICNA